MTWNTSSEFFAMGGYALYEWGSYGMVLAWMLTEPFFAHRRYQKAVYDVQEPRESEN